MNLEKHIWNKGGTKAPELSWPSSYSLVQPNDADLEEVRVLGNLLVDLAAPQLVEVPRGPDEPAVEEASLLGSRPHRIVSGEGV